MKQKKDSTDQLIPVAPEHAKVLLHACCAPCSGAIIESLVKEGIRPTVFFSNSNIVPQKEYELRREECRRYCELYSLEFVDDDYSHEDWRVVAKGHEHDPERGQRCMECFKFRLHRAAKYASANGYNVLATTLASSRWKDLSQVNSAGQWACSLFPGVRWWPRNWRKGGLQQRRSEIIREQNFYNQNYCGCEFSLSSSLSSANDNSCEIDIANEGTQSNE